MLVSNIAQLWEEGAGVEEAVAKGSEDRLRPVPMTASIAIFSLIPMLFATGPGSEVQRRLATVVVGGLPTSTFLTVVILPTLYRCSRGGLEARIQPSPPKHVTTCRCHPE